MEFLTSSKMRWAAALLLLAFPAAAETGPEAASVPPAGYRIAVGDSIQVLVNGHSDMGSSSTVLPDGTVPLPLVGSIRVEGLTADEAADRIEAAFKKGYLARPEVFLNVKPVRIRQIYVHGEVKAPGAYPYEEGITMFQAIIRAGGFTPYAKKRVRILRRAEGAGEVIDVDVRDIENGRLEADQPLKPDDIVSVPVSLF